MKYLFFKKEQRDERYRGSLEARLDKAIELLYRKQNSKKQTKNKTIIV